MALREWAQPLIDWLQRGGNTSGGLLARLYEASALPVSHRLYLSVWGTTLSRGRCTCQLHTLPAETSFDRGTLLAIRGFAEATGPPPFDVLKHRDAGCKQVQSTGLDTGLEDSTTYVVVQDTQI